MKHNLKKLFGWTLTVVMLLTMLLAVTITVSAAEPITVGDFTIVSTDGTTVLTAGTDYTYSGGTLTITTTTPVTVGMKTGVTKTADVIVTDSTKGEAAITFNSIRIETAEDEAIAVNGANKVTFAFVGESSLSASDNGILAKSTVPLVLTSANQGKLSISNTKYGVYLDGRTEGGSLTIVGDIQLDISNESIGNARGIYLYKVGALRISGSPVINIDTNLAAIYAHGIDISGGVFVLKNQKNRVIQAADGCTITIGGNADIHILEAAGGIDASEAKVDDGNGGEIIVPGKIIITDNAKVKMYGLDVYGNRIAGVDDYALSTSELVIAKNAIVDVFTANNAFYGDKTVITGNADVDIKIVTTTTSSRSAIRMSGSPVEISGNATVDIDIDGAKVHGLYSTMETVNIFGSAVVNITGAYRGIFADYINVYGSAQVNVSEDKNYAIYCDDGAFTIRDTAKVTASSENGAVNFYVRPKVVTVTPASGKVYAITQGNSANDPVTVYCTKKTDVSNKSSAKYFHAEAIEPFPVTITFDTDGGSEIAAITQNLGTAITAPADPTKVGYTFAGWDKDIPDTMPGENMTITAKWTVNQYTITFDPNGGSAVQTKTVNYGATIDVPTLVWEGHTFSGWSPMLPATMPAENLTVKAIWDVNTYKLSWVVDGVVQTTDVPFGATITAPADPVKKNYIFAGWDADIPVTMPARDLTFTARWTAIPENNIPQPSGGTVTPSTLTPALGETVTITLIPDSGMQIDTVTVHDADGNPVAVTEVGDGIYTYIQPEGIVTISVTFKEIPRETDLWLPLLARLYMTTNPIIASAGEGGTITSAGITQVKYGRSQDYTIVPDEGYVIADVLVNGKSVGAVSAYTFKKVRRPQIIEVIFVADPNAVVEAPAEESDEVADPMYSYDQP